MAKKSKAFDHSKYKLWIDPNEVTPYEKNAKIHTDKQVRNIVNSIKRFGWQQDTVITNDNVLVIGHGRRLAALKIGCNMPYHVIDKAADELTDEDIRELRIADNQTNSETGLDFDMLNMEIEDLSFDGFDFDFASNDNGDAEDGVEKNQGTDNIYTDKTEIPQYEPSGKNVELDDCFDDAKYTELLTEIKDSKLSEAEKMFLSIAAARHIRFNYRKIADYYAANANPEMQHLMEHSALVLIDYNDAIKNGYAVLRKTVMELLDNE